MATGSISTLFNSGIDAFTNIWDVEITLPKFVLDDSIDYAPKLSVRALSFTPPELSLNTANVDYMGVSIAKQVPKIQGEKTFSIEFRLDANYDIYKKLIEWKHIYGDPSGESYVLAGSLSDRSESDRVKDDSISYGTVSVYPYGFLSDNIGGYNSIDTANKNYWDFRYVVVSKVGTPTFNRGEGDFATVTVDFIYGAMGEPFYEPGVVGGALPSLS